MTYETYIEKERINEKNKGKEIKDMARHIYSEMRVWRIMFWVTYLVVIATMVFSWVVV